MKRPKARDAAAEDELRLYIDNDEPLYRQRQAIEVNMARKLCRGVFSPRRSAVAFKYLTDEAGRKYQREFDEPRRAYPMAARQQVARDLAADFMQRARRYVRKGVRDLPDEAMRILDAPSCKIRRR